MGLTNDIYTKEEILCPNCKKSLKPSSFYLKDYSEKEKKKKIKEHLWFDIVSFQSKDLFDRGYCWEVGDKIILRCGGGLKFSAEGDDVWEGFKICPHCHEGIICDIIIKNGVIVKLKNIRKEIENGKE